MKNTETRNRGHSDNENQSDGRTKTIDSNIFKSSQSSVLFSNPANEMSDTKQLNLNFFVVMLTRLRCRLSRNCQAQTVSTFASLNLILYACAARSVGQLVDAENT